ncbi:MAG: aspartyl/asparaginyl beta-hydroxylase domain-containing protein [Pseudomonadota bacterium]
MTTQLRYFRRLQAGLEVKPFLDGIDAVADAWSANAERQNKIRVQRESFFIPLRGLRKSAINGRARRDVHESRWTTGSAQYPEFRFFLIDFIDQYGGTLGRAKIVRLPAGKRVYPHIDRGEYYRRRDRYHFVLQSPSGSWLKAGDEEVRMREGELWWFDNKQMHEAHNDGDGERIHLIFDVLPTVDMAEGAGHAA